jgi:hypothetical protein
MITTAGGGPQVEVVTMVSGIFVAAGGVAAGIITALANYQKATASRTQDRRMLLLIFDALEARNALDLLPTRVQRYLRKIAGQDPDPRDDDAEDSADA